MSPRQILLAGASVAALIAANSTAGAAPPPVFSPAWFAARGAVRSSAAALARASGAMAGAAASTQSVADLALMAARIRQAAAAQAAAQGTASMAAIVAVPNGLTIGGLQVAPGVTQGGSLWTGAALPVQTTQGGRVGVRVTQTGSTALLNWTTFNVGPHTNLTFDQSAGGASASTWVALNRVTDPSANPTRILGSITAPGHVIIVNPNGIVFGGGAQVNVGALLASTINPTQSDALFLKNGFYSTADHNGDLLPSFAGGSADSAVVVQPGAVIATAPPATQGGAGGSVLLFGGSVVNAGAIDTPGGQTVLAAGGAFVLTQGQGSDPTATTLGTQVSVGRGGAVLNTGIISSALGDVTLTGSSVVQGGVVLSSTAVGQRGTVHLLTDQTEKGSVLSGTYDPQGSVTLAPGSVTAIALDTSGAAAPDATRESLIAQSDSAEAAPKFGSLPDRLDESRVEITTGGVAEFSGGSLTVAQGGQVAVSAGSAKSPGRILVDNEATIDVSGDADAVLPVSANALQISIQTTPLRDAPLNRDTGVLANDQVWVDQRDLVTVPGSIAGYGGNVYTAGGLLAVGTSVLSTNTQDGTAGLLQTSGNIALQTHTIQEWAAVGGTITLFGNVVAAQSGAMLNVAGGGVTYAPGNVPQSWLIGSNGRLYNANTAPADIAYTGVFDGFQEVHPHWSISGTFLNPLIAPAELAEPGYTIGRDAGTVELGDAVAQHHAGSTAIAPAVLFNGAIDASTYAGFTQSQARNAALVDGYQQAQNAVPKSGALLIGQYNVLGTVEAAPSIDVAIGSATSDADAVTATSAIAHADRGSIVLGAASLDGLGEIEIATAGRIAVSAPLAVAPGGTVTLQGGKVDVAADITARSGAVTVQSSYFNGTTTTPLVPQGSAALTLAPGATVDARGVFTNAALDPVATTGEAFTAGGNVTFATEGAVTLGAGSLIDVSAGLAYLPGNSVVGGAGGNVSIAGGMAVAGTLGHKPTGIAGTIQGYGYTGGGTLSVTGLSALITASGTTATTGLVLSPDFFTHGFASYLVDGLRGVTVAPGTTVDPVVPVYQLSAATPFAPSGDAPADALQLTLPPLFFDNSLRATMTQRQGASLALTAFNGNTNDPAGGPISIGSGATIAVDPGQSIRMESYDQLTLDGTLAAPGGSITLANGRIDQATPAAPAQYAPGVSIWLGADSRISAAGAAYLAQDFAGRVYGTVEPGGTISLGAYAVNSLGQPTGVASEAAVIVRPGAVVDASGSFGVIDALAGSPRTLGNAPSAPQPVATPGGTVALTSAFGIYDEGTLRAASGGPGAAGGTLAVVMQAPTSSTSGTTEAYVPPSIQQVPHTIALVQDATPLLPADLAPGERIGARLVGTAVIGADQIAGGGFESLALFAQNAFLLQNGLTLDVPGSITFAGGALSRSGGSKPIDIATNVLTLSGFQAVNTDARVLVQIGTGTSNPDATGTLALTANLIQLDAAVAFGAAGTVTHAYTLDHKQIVAVPSSDYAVSYPGFKQVELTSSGDIRFQGIATLDAARDLALTAAQIYPETNAQAQITAGGVLAVAGTGALPAMPLAANGQLALQAATIEQGGVLRAPEGDITLAAYAPSRNPKRPVPASITLEPGSVTSVSADGAQIPYGGTPDGLTYGYAGAPLGTGTTPGNPTITLGNAAAQQQSITVDPGATIDIGGGGELVGAGFLAGRGGSADVLTSPLLTFSPSTHSLSSQSLSVAPVYAIVPGLAGAFAPVTPADTLYSPVALGQTLTIGNNAAGLPAGSYVLLPAYYALLPGGYRVQLGTQHLVPGGSQALADGSTLVQATPGSAVSGTAAPLPLAVTLTPAAIVRRDSGYNETSFSQFQIAQAAQRGLPRGAIVGDAKTLDLDLSLPTPGEFSFSFAGSVLGASAPGDYGSTVAVGAGADLHVLADGVAPSPSGDSVRASDLDALGAQRLVIGAVSVSTRLGGVPQVSVVDTADATGTVEIGSGASLRAPEIFVAAGTYDAAAGTSSGALLIDAGATLSSLGLGAPAYDSSDGYYYTVPNFGEAVVAVSNGHLVLVTGTQNIGDVGLHVAAGASLLSDGSLLLATSGGVSIDRAASFGARYLTLGAADINIGSAAGLAAAGTNVPAGLVLGQGLLSQLLNGNPASGAPPLQSLDLTANSSLNFFGTVALSTTSGGGGGLQQLVVNTPAIYGFGGTADVASITTGTLYLAGIVNSETLVANQFGATSPGSSVLPGGAIAGGPGTGHGQLDLDAADIVLGYGPDTQADNQTVADRLVLGFSTVELEGTSSISANNRSSLTVYQAVPAIYGQKGSGGALALVTPLLTGSAGSQLSLTAGGALTLMAPPGLAPLATPVDAPGAEIDASAASASIASTVALPAGRLALTTAGSIDLEAGARLDVSGPAVALFDQAAALPGGSVALESTSGGITQDPAALIDVGGAASGGTLSVAAPAGLVSLGGAIVGAGGTLQLRAGTLASFAGLEQALAAGGITGAQSIEVASGSLTVGDITAQTVSLSADTGTLTVTGTIDASGVAPGSIALASGGNLTLAAGSLLDAHGTALQVDGYGQAIAAENTGHVSLTVANGGPANAGQGTLVIAPGAALDLTVPDGVARGVLTLNVPRTGQTVGGLRLSAPGSVDVAGAGTVLVNGFWTYAPTDALGSIVQDNGGDTAVSATGTLGMNQVSVVNAAWMAAAAAGGTLNAGLQASLGGLAKQPGFRLQPGVEIESQTPTGALTVVGDLDLSGFRYGPQATGDGAGTPGALVVRAGGNLTFNGSVSDGFGAALTPQGTLNPDQLGWVLYTTLEPFGQTVVLPADLPKPIELGAGTQLPHGVDLALNYDVTLKPAAFAANTVLPQAVKLGNADEVGFGASYTFASNWTATAPITSATGAVLFKAGQIIPAGTTLAPEDTLGAGTVLPFAVGLANRTVWQAGSSLDGLTGANGFGFSPTLAAKTKPLPPGAILPAGMTIVSGSRTANFYSDFSSSYDLRPVTDGAQGVIEAAAPMLPAGTQSWSMSFVSGANLAAADPLAVQAPSSLAAAAARQASAAGSMALSDLHYTTPQRGVSDATPSLSVIRTGTGALNLVAGGAFTENSLFGIYTAGTQSAAVAVSAPLQGEKKYAAYVGNTQPYFPTGGGDVLVSSQGDLTGDVIDGSNQDNFAGGGSYASELVGDWLRRGEPAQAGAQGGAAWWINFGSYFFNGGGKPSLIGFSGIGTLGGGDLTITAGGDIGTVGYDEPAGNPASQGLVAAVGATGRVTQVETSGTAVLGGTLAQTGGGRLTISASGAVNPALVADNTTHDYYGVVTDLRGDIAIAAAALGQNVLSYGANPIDPRAADPFVAEQAQASGGLVLAPGDGSTAIDTRRDLVLQGVADPTRTPISVQSNGRNVKGTAEPTSAFSVWQPDSSVGLLSAGGNVAFGAASAQSQGNEAPTDSRSVLPPILNVVAAGGSVYFGGGELELAPSPDGALNLLAQQSIFAAQQTVAGGGVVSNISMSGAGDGPNDLPNPFKPAKSTSLFQYEVDTPTAALHPALQPQHFYAVQGDIVGLTAGEVLDLGAQTEQGTSTLYLAAAPAEMMAGRDIVASGTPPSQVSLSSIFPNEGASQLSVAGVPAQSSGNLFLNDGPQDVSSVIAGRDILDSYFYVAGGGLLAVQAGRDLNQADDGIIKSIGPLFGASPTNRNQGAAIAVTVGGTPDYAAFAQDYLTPGNLADPDFPLASAQNAGKVAAVYTNQLVGFLQQYDGYSGGAEDALAAFAQLPAAQQQSFLRQVFYDELIASGQEETSPASPRYHTYIRGQDAIATLFPVTGSYAGSITMYSGTALPNGTVLSNPSTHTPVTFDAGISTQYGGDIDLLAPGGQVVLGSGAVIPGSNTGLITYGSGNINVFALGSVLLGQSRVFTTYGGSIDIWSAEGDISAGVGSKTSLIFSPPLLTYDAFGGITEAPSTPSSGAGIATLAPLAGVPAGDVDLAAPFGTIDAGEAGIRVSGNLNLAAAAIANAANVEVGGKVTGAPTVQVANIGAITAAAAVSGAATNSATNTAEKQTGSQATNPDSIISVEVLSFGG
jgi:filamentous hemagglutinin family protein